MLGLQGTASAPKVYRCVACSDTFPGLASLLVHQASHASALSKGSSPPPTQPNAILQETLFASAASTNEQTNAAAPLAGSPSPGFYICDCGEEFRDFSLMLEHKRSHVSELQQVRPLEGNIALSSGAECNKDFPTKEENLTIPVSQAGLDLSHPSTSLSPAFEESTSNSNTADVALEDHVAMVTPPPGQCTPPPDNSMEQTEDLPSAAEDIPEREEDAASPDKTNLNQHSAKGENLPKNDTLMKLLASAYKNRFPPPLSESQNYSEVVPKQKATQQNYNKVVPKQEATQVEITPADKPNVSPINDLSIAQLRRLLAKPGIKTKAPSISKILELSRKRVVSLTKTLSPVVVLETRQKLMDSACKGTYGRYQCGRCRRVFQNIDKLTEHHFLHKKERIKCCRRCKQLIIGRLPLPDNHVCPQMRSKPVKSTTFKNKSPFAPKIVPFHSLNNTKKVFFCPLCKNSYARRWNLKTHKCTGQKSLHSRQGSSTKEMVTLTNTDQDKSECLSVAVGTEVTSHIKVERDSPESEEAADPPLAWTTPAKSFSPFFVPSPVMDPQQELSLASVQEGELRSWDAESLSDEDDEEGQWTMPLDDETHAFKFLNRAGEDEQAVQPESVQRSEMTPHSLRYFMSNGVKRYPCNRCQKTYSRASTLRRHLRLCGFRPRGFGGMAQAHFQGAVAQNSTAVKPLFSCYVCGRTFNRKDNMMTHRKRCQFKRTMSGAPRVAGNAVADSQPPVDDSGNWGIMSLPSVLPRRVTCECGVGFTSPRLLLEHLQKHAQESYTCPTCGETVNSWADYEVHLQIHMHPHHQLMKGLQPSPPLLVRILQPQQQSAQPVIQSAQPVIQSAQPVIQSAQPVIQSAQPVLQPPQKQTRSEFHSYPLKKQRTLCNRCGNTFASRCSLRRHISWNRCKGIRPANPPKTFNCSHCNADFPNSISLLFHQRNGACKPAIKPVRCPVCLRWFGTMDSLEKHLMTHKQSESYRCDVCQGTYPSLKSLKIHRRRIHRILIGNPRPKTQDPLTFNDARF
ncbi:zinc finger protein 865 [Austrofundulus limnaeus]|uniref:Zinc finger protein 865 n=1 Tax=Austrofundulus limnaeus TaxID=52670 RepID=A0A2I4BWH0_AUSLI|nr:PREDICTED: zinc finger protein 865-like [Austrofundulus limnaeus]